MDNLEQCLYFSVKFEMCLCEVSGSSDTDRGQGYGFTPVLKCGAGEGWLRSVGPVMWEMRKYCIETRRKGISCIY